MVDFLQLTSTRNTPIYIRAASVLYWEAFTFADDDKYAPGKVGVCVRLVSGQWGDTVYALNNSADVLEVLCK